MGFASINPTNPWTDLWNFREKISRIGDFEKRQFWKIGHFEFDFLEKKNVLLHSHKNQSKFVWFNGWVKILTFSLVSRKFLAMRNITLYSVGHAHYKKGQYKKNHNVFSSILRVQVSTIRENGVKCAWPSF